MKHTGLVEAFPFIHEIMNRIEIDTKIIENIEIDVDAERYKKSPTKQ